jgi:hypothetical protein
MITLIRVNDIIILLKLYKLPCFSTLFVFCFFLFTRAHSVTDIWDVNLVR